MSKHKIKRIEKIAKETSGSEISEEFLRADDSGSHSDVYQFNKAQISPTEEERIVKIKRQSEKKNKIISSSSSRESGSSSRTEKNIEIEKTSQKIKKLREEFKELKNQKFISILIHKADILQADYITRHPLVIVHIVEAKTGNYLKLPEERKTSGLYLQPLITGIFDFKENKSMEPYWNEELIFEHDFQALMASENDQVLLLFEIVDLLNFADASHTHDQFGSDNCWYKIAWAFLRPAGNSGISHLDKQVRLQLYKPKRTIRKTARHRCEAYSWWKSNSREKYPSTLYVVVSSVDPPKLEPVYYGQLSLTNISQTKSECSDFSNAFQESMNISRWIRLTAQSCKIPNELYFKTEMTENGCFYIVFSNNGKFLACANSEEYDYPIVIYEMTGKIYVKFSGHKSFIYSLDWSANDSFLLSVSSDQTARIWDVKNRLVQEVHMLPHPSFVYCGKFDPLNAEKIATGCFDHVIRIWQKKVNSFELFQELEGHEGFVNSICFQKDNCFISGDSLGVVIQWSKKNKKSSKSDFSICKKIKIREIVNVIINTIVLHPLGSRLLVHSRDSGLRMLDLSTGVVLQKYEGLKNNLIQTTARISPCGGLLLCGGEDGILNIWSIESGKRLSIYRLEPKSSAVACVDYHPYDHVLVYSTFGTSSSSIILRFNKNSDGKNIGLKMLGDEEKSPDFLRQHTIGSMSKISRKTSSSSEIRWREESRTSQQIDGKQDLKMRLKIFNESKGTLKTKSANRLTSIIAKIDRILSNNSSAKSPYDIEANRFDRSIDIINKSVGRSENVMDDQVSRIMPYVPPLFSNFDDNSVNSVSSTSESKSNVIEMKDFSGRKMISKKPRKSKSAREIELNENENDEKRTAFSDGVVHLKSKKHKFNNAFGTEDLLFGTRPIKRTDGRINIMHESGSDSAGTYIVDENDKKRSLVDSEESLRSDVTFVIENEKSRKPVPKPRKKKQIN